MFPVQLHAMLEYNLTMTSIHTQSPKNISTHPKHTQHQASHFLFNYFDKTSTFLAKLTWDTLSSVRLGHPIQKWAWNCYRVKKLLLLCPRGPVCINGLKKNYFRSCSFHHCYVFKSMLPVQPCCTYNSSSPRDTSQVTIPHLVHLNLNLGEAQNFLFPNSNRYFF